MKLKHTGLAAVATGFILLAAGCGGGGSNGSNSSGQSTQRFAGDYSGAFVAIGSKSGSDVSGIFNGKSDNDGKIAGTVLQDGGPGAVPATGTIDRDGAVKLSATGTVPLTPPVSFTTALSGTASLNNGDSVLGGTLLTTQSNGNNPRGRFVGIRNSTSANPFAGAYSGTFKGTLTNGGTAFNGTLTMTITTSGLIRGTFARTATNVRARPLVGTVDRSGKVQLFTLAEVEVPAGSGKFSLVTTQLTGKAVTSNGVKISGTLDRTGDASINATGTFTATRNAIATN